jgi:hypothetical protein
VVSKFSLKRQILKSQAISSKRPEEKMANELNNSIKAAAEKIVKYVEEVSNMTVETHFVDVDGGVVDFNQAKAAARTIIRLDGDSSTVIPMRRNEAGTMVVDTDLFELHERNVAIAIEYRTQMMDALLNIIKR